MVRKSLLVFLFGLPMPALAQSEPPPPADAQIRDFMAAIPRLDEAPYELHRGVLTNPPPLHREQMTYHYRREDVVAHSFIRDRNARDEVVDPRTRQPRWYRRGELLPAIRLDGEPNACR